jgi:conjugative relaxase-like TrwC/TraI family protein
MMSLHKISSGNAFRYLDHHVDVRLVPGRAAPVYLIDQVDQSGHAPGRWVGSGLPGLRGISAGEVVTSRQLRNLFGDGRQPNAAGAPRPAGTRPRDPDLLGNKIRQTSRPSRLRQVLAQRLIEWNRANGRGDHDQIPGRIVAATRRQAGRELFCATFGREPAEDDELGRYIGREARPPKRGVVGFDLTFSPVKSVSALWAIAEPDLARAIEHANELAIADAVRFFEQHALGARRGPAGSHRVEVAGVVAAVFTRPDSRAGDPDLNTHVAVFNRVQAQDTRAWLSIDAGRLYQAHVTISEVYNSALEYHLGQELGVRFGPRPGCDPRRPVRELVGVDVGLLKRWSQRHDAINAVRIARTESAEQSRGRSLTVGEAIQVAEEAALSTRQGRSLVPSLGELRRRWRAEADQLLGLDGVERMISNVLANNQPPRPEPSEGEWAEVAARAGAVVEREHQPWNEWHLAAELLRQARIMGLVGPDGVRRVVSAINQGVVERSGGMSRSVEERAKRWDARVHGLITPCRRTAAG